MTTHNIDPKLDLVLERTVDISPELVWEAWTTPEHMLHWFCPKPWKTTECKLDLRPGGIFSFNMQSPEGADIPGVGCILEVIENRKLVWTDALLPGYRPAPEPFFTGIILLEPHNGGTKYTAIARHKNEADRKKHEEMGFYGGWSTCLDQLVEHMKSLK